MSRVSGFMMAFDDARALVAEDVEKGGDVMDAVRKGYVWLFSYLLEEFNRSVAEQEGETVESAAVIDGLYGAAWEAENRRRVGAG